jgi:hypothetical protein
MTRRSQQFADLAVLVDALVDETITPEQLRELQRVLEQNPAARTYYVDAIHQHASLSWDLGHLEPDAPELARGASRGTNRWRRVVQFFARPTPLSMTVAALVMGLMITVMAFLGPPVYRQITSPGEWFAETPAYVAVLTSAKQPVWAAGQSGNAVGSRLPPGHKLELVSGVAEVTFHEGAKVVLQGPATFTIQGAAKGNFALGKLVASIPQRAKGFTVSTKHCRIVDLGTEFAAEVKPSGEVEVHVISGEVEVQRLDEPASRAPVRLSGRKALRVAHSGGATTVTSIAYGGERFVSAAPAAAQTPAQIKVFTPDRDTSILASFDLADNNFGHGPYLAVGVLGDKPQRSLLSFDVSPLRGQFTQIEAITLRLFANELQGTGTHDLQVFAIAPANRDWGEGAGDNMGTPTNAGDATWNNKQHAGVSWAGSVGLGTAGADYDPRPLSQRTLAAADVPFGGGTDKVPGWGAAIDFRLAGAPAELTRLVETWLADSAGNSRASAGLLVLDANERALSGNARLMFYQSEFGRGNKLQPQLIVRFTSDAPPTPPQGGPAKAVK